MSLKELTKQNHSNAERSWFAGRMFSGQITNPEYAIYLKQQYESYKALEKRFDSLPEDSNIKFPDERIKRAKNIFEDKIVTEVNDILPFYEAENYHHDYFTKNPQNLYCQAVINPKLKKLRSNFSDLISE